MSKRTRIILGSIAVVAIAVASTVGVGRHVYERQIDDHIDGLLGAAQAVEPAVVTEEDLRALPEPVQRWLRWSGVVGKPMPATVRLRQEGELRVGNLGWLDYTAEEYYSTEPPGFVWTATVAMGPGITVIGQDRYLDGHGLLDMRLLGVVPVASDTGPDMDEGDLLRYLNEIMWFPAAALRPWIAWEPIDDTSARATMTYEGVTAAATFVFDEAGRLTNMTADRFDREDGSVVPWSTPITAWGEFDGIRIPVAGEAVYARPDGDYAYIRLRIIDIDYDRPERY